MNETEKDGIMQTRRLSSPFNIRAYLSRPDKRFDFVPFLDLCLISLFFALNSSRFIFAPGITLDLPTMDMGVLVGEPTDAVLTITEDNLFLFEGRILREDNLAESLNAFVKDRSNKDPIILVKIGQNVNVQTLLSVCEKARISGFRGIQVAAGERPEDTDELFLNP